MLTIRQSSSYVLIITTPSAGFSERVGARPPATRVNTLFFITPKSFPKEIPRVATLGISNYVHIAYTHYNICTKPGQIYPENQAVFSYRTEIRYSISVFLFFVILLKVYDDSAFGMLESLLSAFLIRSITCPIIQRRSFNDNSL